MDRHENVLERQKKEVQEALACVKIGPPKAIGQGQTVEATRVFPDGHIQGYTFKVPADAAGNPELREVMLGAILSDVIKRHGCEWEPYTGMSS